MIGRSGERWSEISVLAAWHDNDDDLFYNSDGMEKNRCYNMQLNDNVKIWNTMKVKSKYHNIVIIHILLHIIYIYYYILLL